MAARDERFPGQADTVEVYQRGTLWFWQRHDPEGNPVGRSAGPFGHEAAARRNARHCNHDAIVMLPASNGGAHAMATPPAPEP